MTIRDKINKMTNEKLAEFLTRDYQVSYMLEKGATAKFKEWLSQEVELTADEMFEEIGYVFDGERFNRFNYNVEVVGNVYEEKNNK